MHAKEHALILEKDLTKKLKHAKEHALELEKDLSKKIIFYTKNKKKNAMLIFGILIEMKLEE